MAYGIVLEFENVGKAQYDAVNAKLGIDMAKGAGDWPAGLTSHTGGSTANGGLFVVEVWESKGHQEAFMSTRLGAALGAVGVPDPVRVTELDIVGYATP
jgi:hypothetical protein